LRHQRKLIYQCAMSRHLSAERDRQPKYERILAELRNEIGTGKYGPGQKFPSEAALVKRFGASRITVGRAVRELHLAGLVERRAGSGTYVKVPTASGRPMAPVGGYSFGLLIPDLGRTEIFEPICQGMADAPEASEHALIWCNIPTTADPARRQEQAWQMCQRLIARNVSGVFFAPFEVIDSEDRINERIVSALDTAGIPLVLLDRDYLPYPRRSGHDLVGIDNRRTGFLATEHLIRLGCRRIAFLSIPKPPSTVGERIAGYREALFMHGFAVDPGLVGQLTDSDDSTIPKAMAAHAPDGFVCANDRTAGRLMHTLLADHRRIPQDVRIVGIDDIAYASLLPVPLTTMHQPCREIGISAMAAMLERIAHPELPPRDVLLECPLVIRNSCGAKAS
jgi:GntR family transcriptional regulator of arabinose operon